MFQYVARRLLYRVVVLFAEGSSSSRSSPSRATPRTTRITPNVSQQTIDNLTEKKHLDDPIPVRYAYRLKDAATNQFGTTLIGHRRGASASACTRPLRQYSIFDYGATTFSFIGLATPVFWLALMLRVGVVYVYQ